MAPQEQDNVKDKATDEQSHQEDLSRVKRMLLDTKVDGGKHSVWSMTLETFGMADGHHKKDDITVDSFDDALELARAYLQDKEAQHASSTTDHTNKTLMDLVPLNEFHATTDQFLTCFLKWAEKEKDEGKTKKKNNDNNDNTANRTKKVINVSKACRRLDAYFGWMQENRESMGLSEDTPLTWESIRQAADVWGIQITYDNDGHFLWWIDLGRLDKQALGQISPRDHLRYVVWFSHLVMLDEKAQNNGAYIIEDMGMMGLFKMATLIPSEVGAKMDRLTIGILPVRVKQIYIFGAARSMALLMALLKPFMGKKMRQRMVLMPRKTNMQAFCDDLVKSRANIPVNFCGLQGEAPRDAFLERFQK